MQNQDLRNIPEGADAYTTHGTRVGKVVSVHPEPAEGAMGSGMGYIEIDEERPEGGRHIHLPLTEVIEVRPDRVVVEVDPDIVARHDTQWIPDKS